MSENINLKKQQDEYQKKRKFTDLMTRAKACFVNKDYVSCSEYLKEALSINPDDLDARELAADILLLNGKIKEAGKEYKAIYDADNTRGNCEEKYAKCVLQVYNSEEKIRQMEAMMHGETPKSDRNSGYMIFLGCIIPGLGRVINEDYLIGALVFVLYLIFIGIAINSVNIATESIFSLFTKPTAIVADIIWLGSIIDTVNIYVSSKK